MLVCAACSFLLGSSFVVRKVDTPSRKKPEIWPSLYTNVVLFCLRPFRKHHERSTDFQKKIEGLWTGLSYLYLWNLSSHVQMDITHSRRSSLLSCQLESISPSVQVFHYFLYNMYSECLLRCLWYGGLLYQGSIVHRSYPATMNLCMEGYI